MRIGLDTSVVLRLLAGEPERLATLAVRRVEESLRRGDSMVSADQMLTFEKSGARLPRVDVLRA